MLPYFRKSEDYKQGADPEYRGKDGPLKVEDYRTILPLTHRFIEGAQQAGHKFSKDLNGREQEGVGYSQMTRKGRWRGSTAQTFLKEARGRPNLRVETEALASKLLFEGKRCVGVAFRQRGQTLEARAHKEVILCGGSVNSPHLLQISGVGPARTPAIDRRAGGARSARGRRAICRIITSRGCRIVSGDRSLSTSWPAARGWCGRWLGSRWKDAAR